MSGVGKVAFAGFATFDFDQALLICFQANFAQKRKIGHTIFIVIQITVQRTDATMKETREE
jgi:hypothetical protein